MPKMTVLSSRDYHEPPFTLEGEFEDWMQEHPNATIESKHFSTGMDDGFLTHYLAIFYNE